jgi:predicted helicase
VIQVSGVGVSKEFSCLVTGDIPDVQLLANGQCFPLYWYKKARSDQNRCLALASHEASPDEHDYIRRDGIRDEALQQFQQHYKDNTMTKEDIFWYVYGVLHSPEYRTRFAVDLKKSLPRIPLVRDFWVFSSAGRKLGDLHLNYETVEPYPLTEEKKGLDHDPASFYRVKKMVFSKKDGEPDKTAIVYNEHLTLRDIPLEAYEYVVNGKSAIEWIMERYAVTVDKESGITNDPNAWCAEHGNPRYVADLLKRIVRVSVESVRLVRGLPLSITK